MFLGNSTENCSNWGKRTETRSFDGIVAGPERIDRVVCRTDGAVPAVAEESRPSGRVPAVAEELVEERGV